MNNSFIENVNYVAGLDNLYGSGIELYKNNLSLKSVQHDIELKFSYYNNDDKKIHSIVHSELGVLVGGINNTLLSFKTLVESSITGSEFTCTVSSGVQNFVINNIVMVSIAIDSNNNTYKAYELEMKVVTAGAVTYDVFGEVKDSLKILPSLATITASDINAMTNVYEIQEEVITVSENIANVETVSDSIANVNTVGISISNVNIVGEDIANVNTVSTHISNVDIVSQSITNVNTVSSNIVDVGIASTNIASINTVANAQNLADIIRVADDLNSLDVNGIADITIVANDLILGVDSNIITVSESIDNVNIAGNDINNINIVGTDIANVDIVSTNINNINIAANDIVSINTVSSSIADVNTVSDGITNVNTVSGSIANVNTVASNIVGLNSIVSNMPEILLADDNAAIATTKALESSDSAAASLQSSLDSAASAALFQNHITDKTNPHEVTKIQVGLGNAENTADADKVVASAGKLTTSRTISLSGDATGSVSFDGSDNADIVVSIDNDSHTHEFGNITGKPTTLSGYGITDADTSAQVTTKINNAVAALVDASPTTLDTLNELAAALGDDPNFATTTSTALGNRVTKNADIVAGTGTKITYDSKGLVTGSSGLIASDVPNLDWSKITSGKPTTLAGYGITNALGITAKAADSELLDGRNGTDFVWLDKAAGETRQYFIRTETGGHGRLGAYDGSWVNYLDLSDRLYYKGTGLLYVNEKAADSNLLDGIDSSEFLRKSTNSTISGNLIFNNGTTDSNGFSFIGNGYANINVDYVNGNLRWFRDNGLSPLSIGTDNNLYADNGVNGNGRVLTTVSGKAVDSDKLAGMQPTVDGAANSIARRGADGGLAGEYIGAFTSTDAKVEAFGGASRWKYLRLSTNGVVDWDIATHDGEDTASLRFRTVDGVDRFKIYKSGEVAVTNTMRFYKNTPAMNGSSHSQGAIELRTTDGSNPILGFHRAGLSACALYENGGQLYTRNSSNVEGVVYTSANLGISQFNLANTVVKRDGSGNFNASDIVLSGCLYLPQNTSGIKTNTGKELLWHNNDYMSLGYGMNYTKTFKPFLFHNDTGDSPEIVFCSTGYYDWQMDVASGNFRLMQNWVDRFKIDNSNGVTYIPGAWNNTTTNGANLYVSSTGALLRVASSIKYKKDIEDIDNSYVENFFNNARPIFYRAKESIDNPIDWGYWGFIAEEVAEYDKRLVFWRYDGETKEVVETKLDHPAEPERTEIVKEEVTGEDGTKSIVEKEIVIPAKEATYKEYTTTKFVEDRDKPMIAEGVQYDRITVLLTAKVQEQDKEIKSLREELDELKLIVKGLIG